MEAIFDRILTLNLIGTTVVFYAAARLYLLPRLGELRPRSILLPILLLHSLRVVPWEVGDFPAPVWLQTLGERRLAAGPRSATGGGSTH